MRSACPNVFQPARLRSSDCRTGSFALVPIDKMHDALLKDYDAMAGMIIGPAPHFNDVLESIATLEKRLNESAKSA
jgi:hypothetical protein